MTLTATLSLASVLAEPARRYPTKTAVIEGDRRLTYAQTWDLARRYAGGLQARGVGAGDRVAIMAPNVIEFVLAYYGVQALGAVVIPVPTLLQPQEAAYLLENSGATLLLHHPALTDAARGAANSAGVEDASIVGFADDHEPVQTYTSRAPEDPAVIFYTSGTTGRPKGAVLTHLNLVLNATVNAFDCQDVRHDDITLGSLPLFHIFGQSVALNGVFRIGGTLVLQPRFDAAAAIDLMRRERITLFFGVPTMFVQLLHAAESATEELPQLRWTCSGGASLPVAVLEGFEHQFNAKIYEGYGLSETSPTATTNQPAFGTRAGTVGHPVWGTEAEIADPETPDRIELLPTGERGEVVLRGHHIFAGYLDNPEATAKVLQDGWFRTGDIGIKDSDGFISIVDRTKDLIIRGGFNVYPREVEETLSRHDAVAQVSVIGIPDAERGEEILAVVVPREGSEVDADELIAWSRERLGKHKYPRRVEIVHDLPLGPSHKVLKRVLRQQFT
ncbi:long-chain-fatty-acid--CoA ligase [Leekyejoonella antrihumi]|uniref:Long-chain fatty acid--CoA ligase n=1 Tax=Leekyejoonella antrihumi TaxID=1660198 RepID=A0A563E488_9MICO|nr:long-chain fatty acid--CoA ligase [Leekyejoonella antrihumi]TWP37340.1 long-chain fatty acid--CoA ligase [Leekyejoonella antrihumi]